MQKLGENLIAASGKPLAFPTASNSGVAGFTVPEPRIDEAVRCSVRALSGFQKEALVTSSRTGRPWRLVSDEGAYLNGHDAAPCPLAFLSCGMAASLTNEIEAMARREGVALRGLRLVLDNYYTMTGSMQRRTMIGGAEAPEIKVTADCDLSEAALFDLIVNAIYAMPIAGLMRDQSSSLFKLAKNGSDLACAKVPEIAGAILPDPGDMFANLEPGEVAEDLIGPIGETPRKEVARGTQAAASSLADEQNRRLNIGAVVELGSNGLKSIQQMQYSPHGTSFRITSSEDGRAPDAASLISAGIGFCFMTQFGRFVSMLKLDLPDYRIVQDIQFSLGGASGETGVAGRTDPVETHVYLTTNEPDETAQEMLDISEQTCFLHAFCRTPLKPKLRVTRA